MHQHTPVARGDLLLGANVPSQDICACYPAHDGGLCVTGDGSHGYAKSRSNSPAHKPSANAQESLQATSLQPVKLPSSLSRVSSMTAGFPAASSPTVSTASSVPCAPMRRSRSSPRTQVRSETSFCMSGPVLTYPQRWLSGVVALTRCANRQAGYVCACLSESYARHSSVYCELRSLFSQ